MSLDVMLAVMAAAAMHAGWNAVIKVGRDRFLSITLLSVAAAVISTLVLPFTDVPRLSAWPWLLTSVALHVGYNLFLVQSYRVGDLGQVYPIARGAAPLMTSIVATTWLGERLPPVAVAGLLLLSTGVVLMAFAGRGASRLEGRAVLFALGTSAFIASYTLTDGIGSRLNGSPHGYAAWLFAIDGLAMFGLLMAYRGQAGVRTLWPLWRSGLPGGAMSLAAYWIVIWAMTRAPIALVAALRETSVLFASAIAVLWLGETLTLRRVAAGITIVLGIGMARAG